MRVKSRLKQTIFAGTIRWPTDLEYSLPLPLLFNRNFVDNVNGYRFIPGDSGNPMAWELNEVNTVGDALC